MDLLRAQDLAGVIVQGTTSVVQSSASFKDVLASFGMKGWATGILGALAAGYAARKAMRAIPQMVARWFLDAAKAGLEGKGINNGDVKVLCNEITLALVKFAEKKLPDRGVGPQKLLLIENALCSLPIIGIIFRWIIGNYRIEFEAMIEESVKRMDEEAKGIIGPS